MGNPSFLADAILQPTASAKRQTEVGSIAIVA